MEKVGRSFVDKVLEFFYGESTSVRMQLFLDVGDLQYQYWTRNNLDPYMESGQSSLSSLSAVSNLATFAKILFMIA